MSTEDEKRYDPADSTLKFVRRKDDITGDEDDVLRVEMSCGHAVDPNSLTGWCRSLLDQGNSKFNCPADVGDNKKCAKEWTYVEIRRHALLTDEEQYTFETKIATIAARMFCDYKETRKKLALCMMGSSWKALQPWTTMESSPSPPFSYGSGSLEEPTEVQRFSA